MTEQFIEEFRVVALQIDELHREIRELREEVKDVQTAISSISSQLDAVDSAVYNIDCDQSLKAEDIKRFELTVDKIENCLLDIQFMRTQCK